MSVSELFLENSYAINAGSVTVKGNIVTSTIDCFGDIESFGSLDVKGGPINCIGLTMAESDPDFSAIIAPGSNGEITLKPKSNTPVYIDSNQAASNTSTGALIVSGGIGIAGGVQCSELNTRGANGVVIHNGAVSATVTADANGQLLLRAAGTQKVNTNGILSINDIRLTTPNNYSFYSDFQVNGNGHLTITPNGGRVIIPSTTLSTSTSTGALTIAGGIGIAGTVYANDIVRVGGETIVLNVAVGGGAIGAVPSIRFIRQGPNLVTMMVAAYTNSSGTTTFHIYTDAGVVPAAFRPTSAQRVIALLIANNIRVQGSVAINTDGTIQFLYAFTGSQPNGWDWLTITYSTL